MTVWGQNEVIPAINITGSVSFLWQVRSQPEIPAPCMVGVGSPEWENRRPTLGPVGLDPPPSENQVYEKVIYFASRLRVYQTWDFWKDKNKI
jgi:hypothetical protein